MESSEQEAEGDKSAGTLRLQKFESSISFQTAVSFNNSLSAGTYNLSGFLDCEGDLGYAGGLHQHHRTNLNYYHAAASFSELHIPGSFTKVRCLGECVRPDGKIELHRWRQNGRQKKNTGSGETVIVKRVPTTRVFENVQKEACERALHFGDHARFAEDCLNEIGIYCCLSQQKDLPEYLLKMHTAFQSADDVWLVVEHADGGELFNVVQSMVEGQGGNFTDVDALERSRIWTWQLLQAVAYLHKHHIGHRDISTENILLCGGSVRLMDFGQSVQTHSSAGTLLRYFAALGKSLYRPPECNIPRKKEVEVTLSTNVLACEPVFMKTADGGCMCEVMLSENGVAGETCMAQPWGYAVPPVDIFACGVCLLLMTTGMPPWRETTLQDQHFAWVHAHGIKKLLRGWGQSLPAQVTDLLVSTLGFNPAHRPTASECLRHEWFEDLHEKPVPIHVADLLDDSPSNATTADIEGEHRRIEASFPEAALAIDWATVDLEPQVPEVQHMPSIAEMEFAASTGFAGDPYLMEDTQRCVSLEMFEPDALQPSTFKDQNHSNEAMGVTAANFAPKKPACPATRRLHGQAAARHRHLSTSSTQSKHRIMTPMATPPAFQITKPSQERSHSHGGHRRHHTPNNTSHNVSPARNPRKPSIPRRLNPVGSAVNAAKLGCKSLEKAIHNGLVEEIVDA